MTHLTVLLRSDQKRSLFNYGLLFCSCLRKTSWLSQRRSTGLNKRPPYSGFWFIIYTKQLLFWKCPSRVPASWQTAINVMAVALSLNTQEFYCITLFVHVVEQQRVFLLIAVIWCLSLLIDTVVPCHQQPRVLWLYWSHLLSSCCAQACFSGAHQSTVGWDRHETLSQALRSVFCSSKTSISPSSLRQASRRFILLKRNPPWRWCVVCHIQVKHNNVTMFILRRCMEKFNWDSRTQQSTCPSPSVISSSKNYVCPFPLITQDVGT